MSRTHATHPPQVHLKYHTLPPHPPIYGLTSPSQVHLKHHTLATPTAKATLYHTVWEQLLEILFPTLATQV